MNTNKKYVLTMVSLFVLSKGILCLKKFQLFHLFLIFEKWKTQNIMTSHHQQRHDKDLRACFLIDLQADPYFKGEYQNLY